MWICLKTSTVVGCPKYLDPWNSGCPEYKSGAKANIYWLPKGKNTVYVTRGNQVLQEHSPGVMLMGVGGKQKFEMLETSAFICLTFQYSIQTSLHFLACIVNVQLYLLSFLLLYQWSLLIKQVANLPYMAYGSVSQKVIKRRSTQSQEFLLKADWDRLSHCPKVLYTTA